MVTTQHRRMIILQNIPRFPKKISTRELLDKVSAQGISSNIRAIQRDLESLSGAGLFAIGADTSSKPTGWFWIREAAEPETTVMDINTAIAFELMRISVGDLLPRTTRNHIDPYFTLAKQLLKDKSDWHKKIAYSKKLSSSLPDISEQDRDLLFEAIDKEMCISASICYLNENQITSKFADVIHPLGLMVNERRTYLVFTLHSGRKIFSAPLHRIQQVSVLQKKITRPKDFDLNRYANSDPLSRCYERSVHLVMDVNNAVSNYLHENPLGLDQEITTATKNLYRLSVTVDDSDYLRAILRGFGDGVTIHSPEKMRFRVR